MGPCRRCSASIAIVIILTCLATPAAALYAVAWKPAVGDALYATPAIAADGTIVLGTGQGWLYAIEQEPDE
ncbi:MAG: PQQ-binding-like beta-propeller repeat protein [Phycisphaerae bacterium]